MNSKVHVKMYNCELVTRQWRKCTESGNSKERIVRTDLSLDTSGTTKIVLERTIIRLSKSIR